MTREPEALTWAQVMDQATGGRLSEALGRRLDAAVFYGTTPPPEDPVTDQPTDLVANLTALVEAVAPHAQTDAEALGLLVGRAYGLAVAETDVARAVAAQADADLTEALAHLEAVLGIVPDQPTWAHDEDTASAAREFLARLQGSRPVPSDQSPEQER